MAAFIEGLVRALREGDDGAQVAAARALGHLASNCYDKQVLISCAGGIAPLVDLLRVGSAEAKEQAAGTLRWLACDNAANKVLIAEAGGITPLVELLRAGTLKGKEAAVCALRSLALEATNRVLIAEAGGIPPLVEVLRNGSEDTKYYSAEEALSNLARDNDANAVAIAAAVGPEALVELARRGRVTVDNLRVMHYAALPAKRKAALVVAALLRTCVPDEARGQVRELMRGVIGPYL